MSATSRDETTTYAEWVRLFGVSDRDVLEFDGLLLNQNVRKLVSFHRKVVRALQILIL